MKEITAKFVSEDVIFSAIDEVMPKELGSRKKINIYSASGVDKNYYAIFDIVQKSRFIRKDVDVLNELFWKLVDLKGHNYKFKYLFLDAPLCSKAKKNLEETGWRIRVDSL